MTAASFPERLRAKRKERKLTQADVAHLTKVSPQAVSQWETGQTSATHDNILALAGILSVDWEWLGYGAEVKDPDKPIPGLVTINAVTSSAPVCTNAEVIKWHEMFPDGDIETWDYLDIKNRDNQDERIHEDVETRFAATGILIATSLEDDSMLPEFRQDDILIFDTGLSPLPGDTVIAVIRHGTSKILKIRKLRQTMDDDGILVNELAPFNVDFAKNLIKTAEDGIILGPLAEMHRFRKRTVGDSRLPSRRARSWEAWDREEAARVDAEDKSSSA